MVQISKLIRKKLGSLLLDEGLLKEDQLQDALKRQRTTGEFLSESVVNLGFLTEHEIAGSVVKQFGLPYLDASKYRIAAEAIETIPAPMMWLHHFIVLDKIGKTLIVAVSNIPAADVVEMIERKSGSQIYLYVSTPSQVQAALEKFVPQPTNGKPAEKS